MRNVLAKNQPQLTLATLSAFRKLKKKTPSRAPSTASIARGNSMSRLIKTFLSQIMITDQVSTDRGPGFGNR